MKHVNFLVKQPSFYERIELNIFALLIVFALLGFSGFTYAFLQNKEISELQKQKEKIQKNLEKVRAENHMSEQENHILSEETIKLISVPVTLHQQLEDLSYLVPSSVSLTNIKCDPNNRMNLTLRGLTENIEDATDMKKRMLKKDFCRQLDLVGLRQDSEQAHLFEFLMECKI